VNNTGTSAATVTLGIYDAASGTKRGTYTTTTIPSGGDAIVPVTDIETVVGAPTASMFHYVVKAEGNFTGFLQHLVTNVKAGVITDMTTACSFAGSAVNPASPVRIGAVFSSAQAASQSFLRLFNTGTTAGRATVTLRNDTTGALMAQWVSPDIAANAEQQFPITTLESGMAADETKPGHYAMTVDSGFSGFAQHVLWRSADGTLTNLSTCAGGITANATKLSGVHSALLADGYPSSIVVNNTGSTAAPTTLGVYDARDGSKRGTYVTASISAGGALVLPVSTIEAAVGAPTTGMFHYVV
jgi:hypothetical protein